MGPRVRLGVWRREIFPCRDGIGTPGSSSHYTDWAKNRDLFCAQVIKIYINISAFWWSNICCVNGNERSENENISGLFEGNYCTVCLRDCGGGGGGGGEGIEWETSWWWLFSRSFFDQGRYARKIRTLELEGKVGRIEGTFPSGCPSYIPPKMSCSFSINKRV